MARSLDDLAIDQEGFIAGLATDARLGRRLLEMGLTSGTGIRVVRRAPLGDPIEIAIRGYRLTLRRNEAKVVLLRD